MTRTGSLLRNVLSNWLVLAIGIAYTFIVTPIVVRSLGVERYGIWSFLNGLLAYSELLYLGLGSALVKYVAQYRARDDQEGLNRLVSVVATIYGVLGLACLLVFAGLSPLVPKLFPEPLAPDTARAASIVCVLLGARLMLIFISSAFAGLLNGNERFDLVNAVQLVGTLLLLALTPALLLAGKWNPLVTLAWLTASGAALHAIALPLVAFRLLPHLRVRPVIPTRVELRWLYSFGLQSFFILFAVKLISYTDTTVIGVVLGAGSVAAYVLPLLLVEMSRMAVGGFAGVFLPQLTVLTTQGREYELRQTLIGASRIAFFMAAWSSSCLIVLGPSFLNRWIGTSVGTDTRYVLLFLALASWLHVLITQIPLAFYQALHRMVRPATILILEAAANLGLSVLLAPRLGITGVALATLLPVVFISFLTLPPYLSRQVNLPFRAFLAGTLPAGLMLFTLNLLAQFALVAVVPGDSYARLAARALSSLPVAVAVFWLMFPASERERLLRIVSRVLPARTATP